MENACVLITDTDFSLDVYQSTAIAHHISAWSIEINS